MKWPLKIHVQRTSEFKYHFLFYCLYILYIQTWLRLRHAFEIARIRDMRTQLFNTWQSDFCACIFSTSRDIVRINAWVKFSMYTPFCQRIWNIWIIIKYIRIRIKNKHVFFTFFSVLSRIVLHSSKFGGSQRSHIRWKHCVSTFLFSCKMLRSLVFWYCLSFFCPLDLSGP